MAELIAKEVTPDGYFNLGKVPKGAFQSDVVQYKNQIPPNPLFQRGGQIQRFAQIGEPFSFHPLKKGGLGGIWMLHPSKATSL
jgi:hypothetical protein